MDGSATDSSPFVAPANYTIASVPHPVDVAATPSELLFTEYGDCHHVYRVLKSGAIGTFATVPNDDRGCVTAYLAISPGFAGFTKGAVFMSQNYTIWEIGPSGHPVTAFQGPYPQEENEYPTELAFDTIGRWDFNLLTAQSVEVGGGPNQGVMRDPTTSAVSHDPYACPQGDADAGAISEYNSSGGSVNLVYSFFLAQQCGLSVAPLSFGSYGGDALVTGAGGDGAIEAVAPNGTETTITTWPGAVGISGVPESICGFQLAPPRSEVPAAARAMASVASNPPGAYFVADLSGNAIQAFPASDFSGLSGEALVSNVTSPGSGGIGLLAPDGSQSLFYSTTDTLSAGAFTGSCPNQFGVLATVTNSTWIDPYEMAYDPENYSMYVSDNASNQVYFFDNASQVFGSATVGMNPTGIAYDPANDEMMVADSGSDAVSYLDASTNTVLGLVPVGLAPEGLAYDSNDQDMYVANNGSNSLTLLGPNNAPAGVVTGVTAPFGLAYDAPVNELFVAEYNGSVAVVRGTSVLGYIPVGGNLTNVAVNGNGTWKHAFVTQYSGSSVDRVWRYPHNGTITVNALPVGPDPFGIAYSNVSGTPGYLWVSNHGNGTVTILRGPTRLVYTFFAGAGIWGVTYDPANGLVYIAGAIQGDPRVILGGGG